LWAIEMAFIEPWTLWLPSTLRIGLDYRQGFALSTPPICHRVSRRAGLERVAKMEHGANSGIALLAWFPAKAVSMVGS